jgi:hypothetical protein
VLRLHLQIGDKSVLCGFHGPIVSSSPAVTARQHWQSNRNTRVHVALLWGNRSPFNAHRYHSTPLRQVNESLPNIAIEERRNYASRHKHTRRMRGFR